MFAFAFKNAEEAAKRENEAGKLFSLGIKRVTGGDYSHVECWLSGTAANAVCSASREPSGISAQTLDLSDRALWSVIEVPSSTFLDLSAWWFSKGSEGKRYDAAGIVGIGTGVGLHDSSQRFCSEYAVEIAQAVFLLPAVSRIPRWMVAPSGPEHDFGDGRVRYGLRDLLLGAGLKEI